MGLPAREPPLRAGDDALPLRQDLRKIEPEDREPLREGKLGYACRHQKAIGASQPPELSPREEWLQSGRDVFPMLCVGDGSFTTIGFQTDGKTVKCKIIAKKPGTATADRTDPYGETGFMSIKWWYGFLLQRPERIGLIKTAAAL